MAGKSSNLRVHARIPCGIRAPSPEPRTKNLQSNRSHYANPSRDPGHQRARPPVAKTPEHDGSEQWKDEATDGPQDTEGANRRRCVQRISIENVCLDALEPDDEPAAVDRHADVGHDPVEMGFCGPAVPQEAEWYKDGGGDHHDGAEFGDPDVVVA